MKDYLTTTELAKLLAISPRTVGKAADRGELAAAVIGNGHRRVHLLDAYDYARRHRYRDVELVGLMRERGIRLNFLADVLVVAESCTLTMPVSVTVVSDLITLGRVLADRRFSAALIDFSTHGAGASERCAREVKSLCPRVRIYALLSEDDALLSEDDARNAIEHVDYVMTRAAYPTVSHALAQVAREA